MKQDTILTINIVEPGLVAAIKKHAKELGNELKGLVLVDKTFAQQEKDRKRDKTGFFQEVLCDFNDLDEVQTVLKPYLYRLLAVTCRYERAILPFRQIIPFVPYVKTPLETSLLWSTEKPLMRDRLKNYDQNLVPKYIDLTAGDLDRLDRLVSGFKFPLIIKPAGLAQSLLVEKCDDIKHLRKALSHAFKIIDDVYEREDRFLQTPSILVEEMIRGEMYSTDAYVNEAGDIFCLPLVKVITADSIGLPGFYSYRHIVPVGLSAKEIEAAFEAARSSIRALNLRSTTTHIEMFYSPEGWKIIEVGARIGGYREDLYREAYGIDHYYNDLAIRMGKEPVMPGDPVKHAAGFNMYAEDEGVIEKIEGLEEAQKLESVVYIAKHAKPGDYAAFAANGGELIIDGILSNKDPDKLEEDMAKVRQMVRISVRS